MDCQHRIFNNSCLILLHIDLYAGNVKFWIQNTTLTVINVSKFPIEREIELDHALEDIKFNVIGLSKIRRMGEALIVKENGNLFKNQDIHRTSPKAETTKTICASPTSCGNLISPHLLLFLSVYHLYVAL